MKKNMGNADRIIRAIIAVVFAVLVLSGTVTGALSLVIGIVSGIFLLTAASGFSPLYVPFGIHTFSQDQHHSSH